MKLLGNLEQNLRKSGEIVGKFWVKFKEISNRFWKNFTTKIRNLGKLVHFGDIKKCCEKSVKPVCSFGDINLFPVRRGMAKIYARGQWPPGPNLAAVLKRCINQIKKLLVPLYFCINNCLDWSHMFSTMPFKVWRSRHKSFSLNTLISITRLFSYLGYDMKKEYIKKMAMI